MDSAYGQESFSIKVFFGNEIRRATCDGSTYATLRDLCAKLCNTDPATVVLKYSDSEEDKITMSSDGELQEALKLMKDKTLRVHIEAKTPAVEAPVPAPAHPHPHGHLHGANWRGSFRGHGHRGGFIHQRGGLGGFPHHWHRGAPMGGQWPHAPPHPHEVPFGGPARGPSEGPFGGPFAGPFGGPFGTAPTDSASHFRNARAESGPYETSAWKEHKRSMKEHAKAMKRSATTEEDRQAVKVFKQQMREEFKTIKKVEKKDKKREKECEKKDKYGKKTKKTKKTKEGKERYVARHVADVTIPDNCELPADTPVTKTWRLRNDGLTAWPADSQLIFMSGRSDDLNGPERVFVGAVEPNQEVEVSVTFVTPAEPRRYIGYYRMASGEGYKFGQKMWVSFIIPDRTAHDGTANTNAVAAKPSAPAVGDVIMN